MQISKILNPAMLLVVLFSLSIAYAGNFGVLNHNSNASVVPIWVAPNTIVNVSFWVTNDVSSTGNISKVDLSTSTNPLKLNVTNALCLLDWVKPTVSDNTPASGDSLNDTFTCKDAPSGTKFVPGLTSSINLTMNILPITLGTTSKTKFVLVTWDDNATDSNSSATNLEVWIDAKGPTVSIENTTQIGNITFNVTFVEGEVAVDVSSYNDSFYGNCSGFVPSYVNGVTCTDEPQNKTCYRTFVVNTSSLPIGTCGINVSIKDTFGNLGSNSGNFAFRNDYENPTVTINSPASGWFKNSIHFDVTADDNYGTGSVNFVQVRWENGTNGVWENLTKSGNKWLLDYDSTSLAEGNYTFRVIATDVAGNFNASETVTAVGIDKTRPVVTVTLPLPNDLVTRDASVSVSANVVDSGAGINATNCSVSIAGRIAGSISYTATNYTAGVCSGTVTVPHNSNLGPQDLTVSVSDAVGNPSISGTVQVRVLAGSSGGSGGSGTHVNVTIANTTSANNMPEITPPKVDNVMPFVGDTITCIPGQYFDKEGNMKAGDKWRWYVNGKIINTAYKNKLLVDTSFVEGDKITCADSATDGMDYSLWVESSNAAIVQVKKEESAAAQTMTAEPTKQPAKPTTPFTGAFLGGILQDDVLTAVVIASFVGVVLAVSTLHLMRKNKRVNYKLE